MSERLLSEWIGPFELAQALVVEGDALRFVMRRWTLWGIPLPRWLARSPGDGAPPVVQVLEAVSHLALMDTLTCRLALWPFPSLAVTLSV